MPGQIGKFIIITIIVCITLIGTACSSSEDSGAGGGGAASNADEIEIQSVPTVTATTPRPTNTPEPTLQTEIIEPISPISPVSPVEPAGQPTVSAKSNAVELIAGSDEPLAAAIKDLSEQTGTPPDEIVLVSIEAIQWRDSSLGCPQEGFMYAQVITPGYKMVLEAQGQQYNYHTDQATSVVLCQE